MKFELGYGKQPQWVTIPDENVVGVLEPNRVEVRLTGEAAVRSALAHPIGSLPLGEIVKAGEKIVIITSDITRPMPSHVVLPVLLDELYAAGIRREDITLVFALGVHRGHTPEEMKKLAGERAYSEIRCLDANPQDCVQMGRTALGTPVDITRVVAEADRRVCLGNIEYHYFAGYSGGAKAIMPGVSTREAIQSNHSRMVLPEACAGRLAGNPVREDLEEAIRFCPIDFILNVVLDEHKNLIYAVAGHYIEAHREGCRFLDRLYKVGIQAKADVVIVSPGGFPKDINLYQAQKALDNASHAVKPGGIIILAASCREGLGERVFERWMLESPSPESMVEKIRQNFELGGHKAAAIAMVLGKSRIFLVSDLEAAFVKRIFLEPYASLDEAVSAALASQGPAAKVLVMPYGGSTLPVLQG
jgi:lactate racemase